MSARLAAAVEELVAALRAELATTAAPDAPPVLLSIDQAARQLGIGRTTLYSGIGRGAIRSTKVGRRRLVSAHEIARLAGGGVGGSGDSEHGASDGRARPPLGGFAPRPARQGGT